MNAVTFSQSNAKAILFIHIIPTHYAMLNDIGIINVGFHFRGNLGVISSERDGDGDTFLSITKIRFSCRRQSYELAHQ
jgi:hypothetical protein